MSQKTLLPSQLAAVAGTIDPDNHSAGALNSDWVSMSTFQAIMAVIAVGAMGASGTIDAKLEQATDSSGTGAKDITGAAITQLTQAGGDDNKQAILQCYAEDLDLANNFTHVRLTMTVATAACDCAGLVVGMSPRYAPASDHDLASVAEIVSL